MNFPIKVVVKPNSKKQRIEFLEDFCKVDVKERAENNKANLAVIKILSKYFKKQVYIKSGLKSKIKIIDVCDMKL
ncbi:DUF167 domain-containing protein [Candidatus Woesearchaeota archaeon]|nr:DUF167 domain-containing protein [Candidatus Woesearchaeota archaeon]